VFLLTFTALFIFWILFSGQFDAFHLALGVASSLFVSWTCYDYLPWEKGVATHVRVKRLFRLTWYLGWLFVQIFLANLHVLRLAFARRAKQVLDPQIIRFETSLQGDFPRYLFATSITLTPGTVTVRIVGNELIVHAISQKTASTLPGIMERKVAWIFGQE
jgi:multicomponent Na+:H+ antiporter subunit E